MDSAGGSALDRQAVSGGGSEDLEEAVVAVVDAVVAKASKMWSLNAMKAGTVRERAVVMVRGVSAVTLQMRLHGAATSVLQPESTAVNEVE